jgi:hypothetical protein
MASVNILTGLRASALRSILSDRNASHSQRMQAQSELNQIESHEQWLADQAEAAKKADILAQFLADKRLDEVADDAGVLARFVRANREPRFFPGEPVSAFISHHLNAAIAPGSDQTSRPLDEGSVTLRRERAVRLLGFVPALPLAPVNTTHNIGTNAELSGGAGFTVASGRRIVDWHWFGHAGSVRERGGPHVDHADNDRDRV